MSDHRTKPDYDGLRHQSWRSQPPFQTLEDYLFFTDPRPKPEAEATPPKPEPTPEERHKARCTKLQKLERLDTFAMWLEKNFSMTNIVALAKKHFQLGRRSAQLYVREVKKRWAEAAQKEDYVAHLWQSRLQYEAGSHELLRALQATDDPKVKASLLRVNLGYLKAKDECMAVLQLHRRKMRRDNSPDSLRERDKRSHYVRMPLGELLERSDNMREAWRHEFQREFEELNGLAPPAAYFVDGEVYNEPDTRTKLPVRVPGLERPRPPEGWGEEWQRREEEKGREETRRELGLDKK